MGERDPNHLDQEGWPEEEKEPRSLFELDQIVGTQGALQELEEAEQGPFEFILRHVTGGLGKLARRG